MAHKANKQEYKILYLTKEHLKEYLPDAVVMKITDSEMIQIAAELAMAIEATVSVEDHLKHILKYRGLMCESKNYSSYR